MSIDATAATASTATITKDNSTSTATQASNSTDGKSFKDELKTVSDDKTQSTDKSKTTAADDSNTQQTSATQKSDDPNAAQKASQNNISQQINKNQTDKKENDENSKLSTKIDELKTQIENLNNVKSGYVSKADSIGTKSTEKSSNKGDFCQTIKMDQNDAMFFVNLVNNQQMTAQAAQNNVSTNQNNMFSDIKSEATQQTVQVSATLMNAINESAKTNQPFRIDFDNNVAVIMKVDKDGSLSANFIPGSTAVENYLRNNIEGLRQSFDAQNLPYNELSYSSRDQKQGQREQKDQQNKKENENE